MSNISRLGNINMHDLNWSISDWDWPVILFWINRWVSYPIHVLYLCNVLYTITSAALIWFLSGTRSKSPFDLGSFVKMFMWYLWCIYFIHELSILIVVNKRKTLKALGTILITVFLMLDCFVVNSSNSRGPWFVLALLYMLNWPRYYIKAWRQIT